LEQPDVNAKDTAQKAGDKLAKGMAGLSSAYDRMDQRAIVGLAFLAIAFILVGATPFETQTGTLYWLHTHGLSPRGYGIALALVGGVILRWPRSRFYGVLTLPFLVYVAGTVGYVMDGGINPIPAVLYIVLYIFILRAK
jgi:peptidoglycan/LPS O-acetylase OafA/YrhL